MRTIGTIVKRQPLRMTALALAAAQLAMLYSGDAQAQSAPSAPAAKDEEVTTVVVSGQRAAMQSAAKLKQNAEEVVDGVVAEEAGKLPDRSITEVLQRIVGVTMDRNRSRGDPEHFSVEGSGISVRGLSWGSSTLNGRESFSAGYPGRELSWGDIPAELMSAVIVHKNPPADLIEGGVSGQVDLRTALPFDYKGDKFAASTYVNHNELGKKTSPALSGLVSHRWENSFGQWGALFNLSGNQNNNRNDSIQVDAYFPRTDIVDGQTRWVPKSASWRTNTSKTDRVGAYAALQWKQGGLESALTYFHSGYKETGTENALFTGVEDPYKSVLINPQFDANGVLQSARYTYPIGGRGANNFAAGGLGFSSNQAYNDRRSQTREIAWNAKWKIDDRWSLQNDLQWVHASNKSIGGNLTLATFVPGMNVDLSGHPGQITFDDTAKAFLTNRANYYLDVAVPHLSKADADLYAWKTDVRFKFDHPVMRDLRFGVRATKRSVHNTASMGSDWMSAAEPWGVKNTSIAGQPAVRTDLPGWASRANLGYLSDPRYGALVETTTYNFNNFFNGKVPMPGALVVPTMAAVRDYGNIYNIVNASRKLSCEDANAARFGDQQDCSNLREPALPLVFEGNPKKTSRQSERTEAVYLSGRFGFDDLRFPIEGSAGVRLVHTRADAQGYTILKVPGNPPASVPRFAPMAQQIKDGRSSVDVLPSLNLKMEVTPELQTRFGFGQSMYRPGFNQLREYTEVEQKLVNVSGTNVQNVGYEGKSDGNVQLRPIKARSFDLTLEWYPKGGGSLTAAVFHKQVRDIIMNSAYTRDFNSIAGNAQTFLITAPDNVADGKVTGLEIAGQTYLNNVPGLADMLPEWSKGFGVAANYTYIKSQQTLHHPFNLKYCPAKDTFNNSSLSLYGCDTNGLPFTEMPLQYLSRNAYNLTFLYDKGPVSMRLAYSWRGRFLQGVQVNGTSDGNGGATSADPTRATVVNGKTVYPTDVAWGLPTWQEAAGQLDFGLDYKISGRVQASFSASNLTDAVVRQTQQQSIGNMPRAWFEPGRSYRLALRYTY